MPSKPTATRGRPKKTIEEIESIRKNLLMATSQIFGDCGSQGTTVAKIIQSANVSRPTFYKYFTNANEPLELVIEQANIRLVEKIKKSPKKASNPFYGYWRSLIVILNGERRKLKYCLQSIKNC
jgi:AcrR family transcriptional regulator